MNRFDIINRIGDKYRVGNTESGEFSYVQALKTVGKDIKDYQKATSGTQHQYLDIRFENDRLAILVETKNKFSKWDKAKIKLSCRIMFVLKKHIPIRRLLLYLRKPTGMKYGFGTVNP